MQSISVHLTNSLLERVSHAYGQMYFVFQVESNCFTYLNPSVPDVLGLKPEDFQQNPELLLELVHQEDQEFIKEHYQSLLKGQEQEKVEFRIHHPEKDIRWLCLAGQHFREEGGTYLCGYAEDITKRKEYLYNTLKFNAKKNSTLEILSHDLAAPFAMIKGLTELLEMPEEQDKEDLAHILKLIKENAQSGSDMIRDFVNNEFLESVQVELNKERIDIVERVTMVMQNYQEQAGLMAKRFVLKAQQVPIFMYVDEMKFMQVLNNLISNAIKFTQDNGTITLTVEDRDKTVFFSVEDDGIGIPERMKPLLFDKFTKARREGIRGEKSVGMGMSIIRNIVELHQGRIWFESTENVGSTFFLDIPKE